VKKRLASFLSITGGAAIIYFFLNIDGVAVNMKSIFLYILSSFKNPNCFFRYFTISILVILLGSFLSAVACSPSKIVIEKADVHRFYQKTKYLIFPALSGSFGFLMYILFSQKSNPWIDCFFLPGITVIASSIFVPRIALSNSSPGEEKTILGKRSELFSLFLQINFIVEIFLATGYKIVSLIPTPIPPNRIETLESLLFGHVLAGFALMVISLCTYFIITKEDKHESRKSSVATEKIQ